jgi:hypothetical protein
MSTQDFFMRTVFDSIPDLHKLIVSTSIKGLEEAKKIEGNIDSRDEEACAEG